MSDEPGAKTVEIGVGSGKGFGGVSSDEILICAGDGCDNEFLMYVNATANRVHDFQKNHSLQKIRNSSLNCHRSVNIRLCLIQR